MVCGCFPVSCTIFLITLALHSHLILYSYKPLSLRGLDDDLLHNGALVEVQVSVSGETLPLRQSLDVHIEILITYSQRPTPI